MNEAKRQFIENNKSLFWSVAPEKRSEISDILLVETILNYGNWDNVQTLFNLLGLSQTAAIFFQSVENRNRTNYFPEVENYFQLYFKRRISS